MIYFPFVGYADTFPNCSYINRPIIPIKFKDKFGETFKYPALIDSGADHCIFHPFIAKEMGIDIKSGMIYTFGGIGKGELIAYVHEITFFVGNIRIESYCGFSYDFAVNQIPYGILGQHGFLDQVNVKMNNKEKYISICKARKAKKTYVKQNIRTV